MGEETKKVVKGQFYFFFFFFLGLCTRHRSSQARGQVEAAAAGLCHSHSYTESQLLLKPTPELRQCRILQPTDRGQESNLGPHGY